MTIDDHYYETRFVDAGGAEIAPQRFRTVQEAMAEVVGFPEGYSGAIWFRDGPDSAPVEVLRQNPDGSMVDALHDDGTNYPLDGVPEGIEPGPMMFSLWLTDADGHRAAYDFGFYWDGGHSGQWQCGPARGGPSWEGTLDWSQEHVYWIDYDEEPDPDDLGDDLVLTYTASGQPDQSQKVVLPGAAVTHPFSRDSWVELAGELFGFLRENGLI